MGIEPLNLPDELLSVFGFYPHAVSDELRMRRMCKEKYHPEGQG